MRLIKHTEIVDGDSLVDLVKREFGIGASIHLSTAATRRQAAIWPKRDGFEIIGYYLTSCGEYRAIIR